MVRGFAAVLAYPLIVAAGAAPAPPTPPPPTPPVQQVAPERAAPILGQSVTGPDGKEVGRLVDVLVNDTGEPMAAVIDVGGFLGVGNRKVAVDWKALHFAPADKNQPLMLDLQPDQVRAAPDYKETKSAPVLTSSPATPPIPVSLPPASPPAEASKPDPASTAADPSPAPAAQPQAPAAPSTEPAAR